MSYYLICQQKKVDVLLKKFIRKHNYNKVRRNFQTIVDFSFSVEYSNE